MKYPILQYAPYYLNQMVQYRTPHGRTKRAKLTGVSVHDQYIETTYARKDSSGCRGDIIGKVVNSHDCNLHNVRLELRALETMTKAEAHVFLQMEGWSGVKNIRIHAAGIDFDVEMQSGYWVRETPATSSFKRLRPAAIIWLCERGFDVFDLFAKNLAVKPKRKK